jgi:ATP-dependent exoDNAse (exonuclease V) beta subunit
MSTTMTDAIRLCSIYSFKGLESPVVILSELERANQDVNDALIYVGLSRARNQVLVIGDLPAPS